MPPAMDGPAETPLLEVIYRTMVHNHKQAQKESRKVKLANRQLQLSIKKVVKSCQDIGMRIASMETCTEELETEVRVTAAQTVTQGQQISDIQWKLEDAENRQRQNNLPIRNFLSTVMTQGLCIDKIKLMAVVGQPTSCGIKNVYPLLLNSVQDDMALLVKNWEGRLGAKELDVCESIEMAQTILLSAGPQAQHFMVLYNLYYTPAKIASWGKTAGTTCPQCGSPKADLCHMFFECVKLSNLISAISEILRKIMKQAV
ncbi:hypothetical protein NDU88_006190 [Pleurodeles waltl]|uniref:Uncharacterized protein n=1 Tax=Pleurodeles waltl TaxID=8319 RepID=A0AAV7NYN6_PLEWA|nr:hypothetical protein NDU88_006190 [Pleurodeles waltl]